MIPRCAEAGFETVFSFFFTYLLYFCEQVRIERTLSILKFWTVMGSAAGQYFTIFQLFQSKCLPLVTAWSKVLVIGEEYPSWFIILCKIDPAPSSSKLTDWLIDCNYQVEAFYMEIECAVVEKMKS